MITALLNALRRRFGLRARRWPMVTFPRRPQPRLFRLVKRDGLIYIVPQPFKCD